MTLNSYQKISIGLFIPLIIFWSVLFFGNIESSGLRHLYGFLYGIIPLFGGIAAVRGYREWGGMSTILGRAILFMGLGLFFWGIGEGIRAYAGFFEKQDSALVYLVFAPSVILYTIGTIYLSLTTGIRLSLQYTLGRIYAIIMPILILVLSYYLFNVIGGEISDKGSFIKSVLGLVYPLAAAASLAVTVVVAGLSFKYLGGLYKKDIIFILIGLTCMFAAQMYYSYTITIGTASDAGLSDILFTLALFLLTIGLLGFNKIRLTVYNPA